jgi:ABC-type nitrate/sulfonate/bicarbonate transport system substrate-binding protein
MGKFINKILITAMIVGAGSCAYAQKNQHNDSIKVAMLMEHEGFLMWYAKKQGWDKELNFNIDLEIYSTNGLHMMEDHRQNPERWNITAVSSVPLLTGSKNIPLDVIAFANDESPSTAVMVNSDSEMLSVQGWNEDYPHVYGSPETIRGKTFIVKGFTSATYTLARWLEIFDLTLNDIKVERIVEDQNLITKLKSNHEYGGVALWSPYTYDAKQGGLKKTATAQDIDAEIPIMMVVDADFGKNHPELVAKCLAVYIRAVEAQLKDPMALVADYKDFYEKYSGRTYDDNFLLYDLNHHIVIDMKNQLRLFETTNNSKSAISRIKDSLVRNLMLIIKFFEKDNFMTNVSNRIKNQQYITDRYLKIAYENYYIDENGQRPDN